MPKSLLLVEEVEVVEAVVVRQTMTEDQGLVEELQRERVMRIKLSV